ncbi:MAG: 3-hydroxyacyl-ACP dehydratase [Saprospiraceae bacterium]
MIGDILPYIPQRAPMVMVDNLLEHSEQKAISSFEIRADNLFLYDGTMNGNGLIENIAQTAAAHAGYHFFKKNESVKKGFIAGIKDFKIVSLPAMGQTINTQISVINQVMDFTIIEGKVYLEGILIASCEMRIFTLAA